MKSRLDHLELTDFRSYAGATLALGGRGAYLVGPNGAGKTNLLEAVSFLSPGRGLRGASLAEVGRRAPGEAHGRPWAAFAVVATDSGEVRIGTGVEAIGQSRRQVRIDGEDAPQARLMEHLRPLWLTPSQDRLFLDGASDRRRFLDRLVFAAEPAHAGHVAAYDRALRERTRLLGDGPADEAWLTVLETRLAAAGARVAGARARTLNDLAAEIAGRGDRPFPGAGLALSGEWETLVAGGAAPEEIEARLAAALAASRGRDAAAGRALVGPHRGDLIVTHLKTGRPAAQCSTGEQKALILNLVLAQGARLSRADSQPNPILLLDEVAAHLDGIQRGALFDEIEALSLQALLTGTDESLFATLKGRALRVHVDASSLTVLDD
ncbi:MAG: DNA replication/repair protein RecF [Caulobacteraceae bacterium]|nr:DNA replication/repair protein RecF [Caulobacteraceae bacterium]